MMSLRYFHFFLNRDLLGLVLVLFLMVEGVTEIEFTVRGRVQMVMYRDFAKRKANGLKLTGFVKNNRDGSVTVLVQGQKDSLEKFEEYLKKGPLFAKVENIVKKEKPVERTYGGFEITY
ncbi:MAG: acylphosphatase [bacterium]|nr:acylphosphatase [bacterium]